MRNILISAALAVMLGACSALGGASALFGPQAADVISKAEDRATDEAAERVEDICDAVPQTDIDRFYVSVNDSMDVRADGTKPIARGIDCRK